MSLIKRPFNDYLEEEKENPDYPTVYLFCLGLAGQLGLPGMLSGEEQLLSCYAYDETSREIFIQASIADISDMRKVLHESGFRRSLYWQRYPEGYNLIVLAPGNTPPGWEHITVDIDRKRNSWL